MYAPNDPNVRRHFLEKKLENWFNICLYRIMAGDITCVHSIVHDLRNLIVSDSLRLVVGKLKTSVLDLIQGIRGGCKSLIMNFIFGQIKQAGSFSHTYGIQLCFITNFLLRTIL